jgi:receptor expression-enhancing protein 1/2/3/4
MMRCVYVCVKLVLGTLYPAYCSFKAVKTKNVKEYVQWMTYWIVYSVVLVTEEVTDLFLSFWFPLYYELKILLLLWLLSPTTRGSTFLYRQVIHPTLSHREEEIDHFVKKCKDEGVRYTKVAAQKVTSKVIETALAGGGGLVRSLRHSYSLSDLRSGQQDLSTGHDSDQLGSVASVRMRTVRGRSRVPLESTVSLTTEAEVLGDYREERTSRRRKTSSLYGTLPKGGSGHYGHISRNMPKYGSVARRQRPGLSYHQSKEDLVRVNT